MMFSKTVLCLTLCLFAWPTYSQTNTPQLKSNEFLTGADISLLPLHEKQGVKYFDAGQADNLISIAKRNGWRVLRVRLWVNPANKPESEVSNLENVTNLGRRIKAAGLRFLLDIHYSDTWADPGHQKKPAAWGDLPFPELLVKVHDYSREVIAHLRENKALPDIVQVGNEIKNGFLYGSGVNGAREQVGGGFWEPAKGGIERAMKLFVAGTDGVRDGSPQQAPLIMLHIPDGQDTGFIKWYFSTLDETGQKANPPIHLNYDLIGLSYYPADPWDAKAGYEPWHLSHLEDSMTYIATTLHKPLMVVETNWPQAGERRPIPDKPEFAFTPEGQAQFYRALIDAVRAVPDGMGGGVLAWDSDTLNWQSVFDAQGNALPSLRALGQK